MCIFASMLGNAKWTKYFSILASVNGPKKLKKNTKKCKKTLLFDVLPKSFFWIGRVWVTFERIWERSGKGFGDVWGFSPTSMSSKMDQRQLQAFVTVRKAEKHLMFAKAKSRKRKNENEIQ